MKIIKCDFAIFNVSLNAASQIVNLSDSLFNTIDKSSNLLPSIKTLVSSAKRMENNVFETLCKSLIDIINISGPRNEHCGIPQ